MIFLGIYQIFSVENMHTQKKTCWKNNMLLAPRWIVLQRCLMKTWRTVDI